MSLERIDKILSSKNLSRKEAKELIKSKRVTVNQKMVADVGFKIDVSKDVVCIDQKPFFYQKYIYIMQNKPQGIVSASSSPSDKTVIDILPEALKRPGLFPAGRLDKDTTGFVLITNDGEFAHNILSPKHHVQKTYHVTTQIDVDEVGVQKLEQGLELKDGTLFLPAKVQKLSPCHFEIQICEGKYHQIKRMFSAIGSPLIALRRVQIGNLPLDHNLRLGDSKELTPQEIKEITKC